MYVSSMVVQISVPCVGCVQSWCPRGVEGCELVGLCYNGKGVQ